MTAEKNWRYNRYFLIEEYRRRSIVALPFSIVPNLILIVRAIKERFIEKG